MTEDKRIWAFLDASVLYPALLRNLLMRLAVDDVYRAFWSRRVQDEWTQALFRDRPHLTFARISRTRRLMDDAIENATVSGFDGLIDTLVLPDANDRHVLAAAIHCGARVLVTANLRHFPAGTLATHDIEAKHPDAFILGLLTHSPHEVVATLRRLLLGFSNPRLTPHELLSEMARQGLPASARALHEFVGEL